MKVKSLLIAGFLICQGILTVSSHTKMAPVSFAFAGDIMMGTTYPDNSNYLPPEDGANLFQDVAHLFKQADFAAANLEGTMLDGPGQPKKCTDPNLCYFFRMPTRYVNHLKNAGIDFVSVANNHVNDFGPDGLTSTQSTLSDNGLLYAGLRESCPTAVTTAPDGRKIGFAAFGHNRGTLSILDFEEVRNTVNDLKKECDFVVVSFHGGGEGAKFTHVPHATETCFGENRGNVEAFAHAAVDAGADVVYGHGPHVPRAMELYNDHLIMYSLGNFCTPFRVNLAGVNGEAPLVTVTLNPDGTFKEGKINSFKQIKGIGPRKDASNSVAKTIKKLSQTDFPNSPLEISDDGILTKK
ncbi:MAG: CapA family protein [Muribaculaceae bacterium]|nr:CapA family protein [Muribaculaceae bacterium]